MTTNGKPKRKIKKAARPVGRPRALTPDKQANVIRYIETGGSRKHAAMFVGCAHQTIADEARRNEEFSTLLAEAEAKCVEFHLNKIKKASSWQASAWYLGRKYPEEYAETNKHALTNAAGEDLTPHQRQKLIDAIIQERKGLMTDGHD